MSWTEFWVILTCCAITILICRTVPLLALKNRELPKGLKRAVEFIPSATFAALVANDVISPGMFNDGIWPAAAILIATACVVLIAVKTRSLVFSAIGGVASYALLMLI